MGDTPKIVCHSVRLTDTTNDMQDQFIPAKEG